MTSNDERRIKILEYVINRQKANQRTTKADVIRHMSEEGLSSGETTHNLIKNLIDEGKLNVEVINSQVHFLTINEKFNFEKMQQEVLRSYVQEAMKPFGNLVKDSNIKIKMTKRPNSKGYDYSIHVYGGSSIAEVDIEVNRAIQEELEKQKKAHKMKNK